ncbi:MAG: tRNA pseudouridine(38-40) synthase TruA [Candidatus Omnitrophica bacterium]|nr:tRNA pseudouridine(38-40) synthase TruA [Candidatus Omnitrophota bacterium]
MKNIKLIIEYDGTNYNGWQRQDGKPKLRTLQAEIEKAIKKITGAHSNLHASGRTDSGVHAKAQIANFHTKSNIDPYRLKHSINSALPKDISITDAQYADDDFHSRFCAKSKIYRYTILNRSPRSPFLDKFSLRIPYRLNLALMKKEAKVLLGKHDFKSFKASGIIEKNTTRTIRAIKINKDKNSIITIDIEADGFLHHMVRNIAGTLLEIARGKLPEGSMEKILGAKDRKAAGLTLPAKGLCLMEVKY